VLRNDAQRSASLSRRAGPEIPSCRPEMRRRYCCRRPAWSGRSRARGADRCLRRPVRTGPDRVAADLSVERSLRSRTAWAAGTP